MPFDAVGDALRKFAVAGSHNEVSQHPAYYDRDRSFCSAGLTLFIFPYWRISRSVFAAVYRNIFLRRFFEDRHTVDSFTYVRVLIHSRLGSREPFIFQAVCSTLAPGAHWWCALWCAVQGRHRCEGFFVFYVRHVSRWVLPQKAGSQHKTKCSCPDSNPDRHKFLNLAVTLPTMLSRRNRWKGLGGRTGSLCRAAWYPLNAEPAWEVASLELLNSNFTQLI